MLQRNVLPRRSRPTTKSYRRSVREIICNIQAEHGLTDAEFAERIGCSVGTVRNARNEASNLDGATLAAIQFEFGEHAIDPFQSLSAARGVPENEGGVGDLNTIMRLAEAISELAKALDPESDDGASISRKEAQALLPVLTRARRELDQEITRLKPLAMGAAA